MTMTLLTLPATGMRGHLRTLSLREELLGDEASGTDHATPEHQEKACDRSKNRSDRHQ
jgi:hypothetical protein